MLYIQDRDGSYLPAPKETIFTEARRISGYQLRRGVSIKTSDGAKAALQYKLGRYLSGTTTRHKQEL